MANPYDYIEGLIRRIIDPIHALIDAINRLISSPSMTSDRNARIANILSSAIINQLPAYHQSMTITTTVQEITRATGKYRAVRLYNNDPAQPLWHGRDNLTIANGEILRPGFDTIRVLAPGDVIYGVCLAATINIRFAVLEDLNAELRKLPEDQL
jgi:hypothetical protein